MLGIKNYRWIWIAADREAREYVDFVVGDKRNAIQKVYK
jgi:IS1 family transposase